MSAGSRRRYLARLRNRYAELMIKARTLCEVGAYLSADETREFGWLARRCAEVELMIGAKDKERDNAA